MYEDCFLRFNDVSDIKCSIRQSELLAKIKKKRAADRDPDCNKRGLTPIDLVASFYHAPLYNSISQARLLIMDSPRMPLYAQLMIIFFYAARGIGIGR